MVFFHNIGLFSVYRLKMPIVSGREPTATEEEKRLGSERSAELSAKINQVTISQYDFFAIETQSCLSSILPLLCLRYLTVRTENGFLLTCDILIPYGFLFLNYLPYGFNFSQMFTAYFSVYTAED